ncbi:hypothetical protein ACTFIZ_005867, partial [Dictyostelium cf. discoideum]
KYSNKVYKIGSISRKF